MESKPLSTIPARARKLNLRPWEEAVGKLLDLNINSYTVNISLSIKNDDFLLEVPVNEFKSDLNKFNKMRGKIIAIIRVDKGFIIKEVNEED